MVGSAAVPVSMPDENQLPLGPLRDLTQAIHVLYVFAGTPGTRRISDAIKERDDFPATVSHEAVRSILLGHHAGWPKIQSVVMQLVTWAVNNPDPAEEIKKFHKLWMALEEHPAKPTTQSSINRVDQALHNEISPFGFDIATSTENSNNLARENGKPEDLRSPLISWRTRGGTLDVYDRQMAIQLIKDIGFPND